MRRYSKLPADAATVEMTSSAPPKHPFFVSELIGVIFLNFFSNDDYTKIDLKSVSAFRLVSKKIRETIDTEITEKYPHYARWRSIYSEVPALLTVLRAMQKDDVHFIVRSGCSATAVTLRKNTRRINLTKALLEGHPNPLFTNFNMETTPQHSLYHFYIKPFLSYLFLFSSLVPLSALIIYLLFYASYPMGIFFNKECRIINEDYRCSDPFNMSCNDLKTLDKNSTLRGSRIQTLLDFCGAWGNTCRAATMAHKDIIFANHTFTRYCEITDATSVGLLVLISIFFWCLLVNVTVLRRCLSDPDPDILNLKNARHWPKNTMGKVVNFFSPPPAPTIVAIANSDQPKHERTESAESLSESF